MGVDGPWVDYLGFKEFYQGAYKGIDLSLGSLSCQFYSSSFEDCDFEGTRFSGCGMAEARFSRCSFKKSRIVAPYLERASFEACDFSGAHIKGRNSCDAGRWTVFASCSFKDAQLKALAFGIPKFINCSFDGASFLNILLRNPKYEGEAPKPEQFTELPIFEYLFDDPAADGEKKTLPEGGA